VSRWPRRFLVFSCVSNVVQAATDTPRVQVERTVRAVATMQDARADQGQRREAYQVVACSMHDRCRVSRNSVGAALSKL
jgi:hypothetical protein